MIPELMTLALCLLIAGGALYLMKKRKSK